VAGEKAFNSWRRRHECGRKFWEWNRSNDDQQSNAIAYNCLELVWLVSYSPIVGDRDPIPFADFAKPEFVSGIGREVVVMALNSEAGRGEYFRESFP
jgi:hypothetical protein